MHGLWMASREHERQHPATHPAPCAPSLHMVARARRIYEKLRALELAGRDTEGDYEDLLAEVEPWRVQCETKSRVARGMENACRPKPQKQSRKGAEASVEEQEL